METNNIGIYMWTSPEGKSYIGQSTNLKYRYNKFKQFKYRYSSNYLEQIRRKYNNISFWKYTILEYCSQEDLNIKEKYYINYYKTTDPEYGYNIIQGGNSEKQVIQLDLNNNIIAVYNSISDAHRTTNIHLGHISECCNGFRNTVSGFKWKFKNL